MVEEEQLRCPVDHSSRGEWLENMKSIPNQEQQSVCPVNHNDRKNWLDKVSVISTTKSEPEAAEGDSFESCNSQVIDEKQKFSTHSNTHLPTERQISSIPRSQENKNWVYPSEKQFFDAMRRKNWNPNVTDMKTIVPIHNAVNEMAWFNILNWEKAYKEQSLKCGGVKLTSFKGVQHLTPRAWFNTNILGYQKPFDRHDWVVDRCGTQIEYVIDFYSGNSKSPSLYLDVRPKINSWEGVKLRLMRVFDLY